MAAAAVLGDEQTWKRDGIEEYGAGNMVSTHGDIYSYGILVLETVTGKRPTDSKFIQVLSLRKYVELGLRGRMLDVVDTQLSLGHENELQTADDSSYKRKIDYLISLVRLGVSCSQEMPSSRMSTGDIIKELHAIKDLSCRNTKYDEARYSIFMFEGAHTCSNHFQPFALYDSCWLTEPTEVCFPLCFSQNHAVAIVLIQCTIILPVYL